MSLFTENEVRARGKKAVVADTSLRKAYRNPKDILVESMESYKESKVYDIFVSHSIKDAELILGMKGIFEDMGYSVYVDWIDDMQLNRSKVSEATANILRQRMRSSKSLFFVTTENTDNSKWMPWECGYFDGLKEKVAIVPVKNSSTNSYQGQEYLGLYPYCIKGKNRANVDKLWIHKDSNTYLLYDDWLSKENKNLDWKML